MLGKIPPRFSLLPWLASATSLATLTVLGSPVEAADRPASTDLTSAGDKAAVFEGRFETRVADMFDGTQRISHHLVANGGDEIELDIDPMVYPDLKYQARVRAYGTRLDRHQFAVDWLEVTKPAPEPLIGPDPRPARRIATLLVHPGTSDSMTTDELTARVYTNEDSTQRFFIENSYGMESFAGEAFGPYTISNPGGCDYQAIADGARAAFAADGGNLNDYDQFMYYMPRVSGCGWSGLASVGSPDDPARDSWYNGSAGCTVLAQELAHNYGLMHTRTYINCSSGIFPGPSGCQENEYGSPYDPMGRGCGHTGAYQKAYMGWFEECNIVTTQANGTYNLLPTELPCNGTQTLQLPLGDGNFYYLEYRQPVGQFDNWSGVLVYYGPEYTGGSGWGGPEGYLVNVTDADDWYMHAGESYQDFEDRVTFSVVEENDTHAVIQVSYPSGSGSPTCAGGGAPVEGDNGNIGTLECADGPTGGDPNPPTVSITAPPDGQMYDGPANFQVTADAMDDVAVVQVELRMNGTSVATDNTAPYEWDVADLTDGTYEFEAIASDGSNRTTSDPITVTVVGGGDTGDDSDTDTGDDGDTDTGDDGDTDTGDDGDTDTGDDDDGGTDTGDEDDGTADLGEDGDTGDDGDTDTGDDTGTDEPPPTTTTSTTTGTTSTTGPLPPGTTTYQTTTVDPFGEGEATGCACTATNAAGPGWLAFLLLPVFGRRRRRSAA